MEGDSDGYNTHHEVFPESWYKYPSDGMDPKITREFRQRRCRKVRMRVADHDRIDHDDPPPMPSYEAMLRDFRLHEEGRCDLCRQLELAGLKWKTPDHPAYVPPVEPSEPVVAAKPKRRKRSRRSSDRPRLPSRARVAVAMVR